MDLPQGFEYVIVSRAGVPMDDGLRVPHSHDGMAAFAGEDGRVNLVCNHELEIYELGKSAFPGGFETIPVAMRDRLYDAGNGKTPGNGGTTTTVFNPASGKTERQHLSLAGTEINCAGGPTPWGSWLSCEECHRAPGSRLAWHREQAHGYVFEVPADATGLVDPVPLRAMGRFTHEAAAVHAATGIVYLTEDMNDSIFYRFVPTTPGKLADGGRLQALTLGDHGSVRTDNWSDDFLIRVGEEHSAGWVDLDNVDSDKDDLRHRGAARGAAVFVRGEGICSSGDDIYFGATEGGSSRRGQVFRYSAGGDANGTLTLVAECSDDSMLAHPDNMTVAPWGDLLVCEDTGSHCGIVGITADGRTYTIADNAHSNSELAGVCFSPDGSTLFVNIQYPGMTIAITGPWPAA